MEQHIPNEQPAAPAGEPVIPVAPAPAPAVSHPRTASASAADPVKHKLNHSYIWLGALRILPIIIAAAFASSTDLIVELALDSTSSGLGFIAILAFLVIILLVTGIVMLVRFISYRCIWYEYAGDEFSYYSGIISKKRVHIPYQRIQSINQKASLFQRIAGVCTVSIETAGGAENKAVILPYVEKSAAEALRRELFERKQRAQMKEAGISAPAASSAAIASPTGAPVTSIPAPANPLVQATPAAGGNALDMPAQVANDFRGVFGGEAIDMGTVTYEYGLSNKQLTLAAITGKSSFTMVFFSIVMAAASLISSAAFVLGMSEDAIFDTLSSLIGLIPSSWIVGAIASVVGFVLVIMIVVWLIMVASTCISYGGFRTRRRGARIETEYGIISHNFNGIDIDRIQSVEISQSFFQRILKSCTLSLARVASAAQESSSEAKNAAQAKLVIHPFVKLDQVDAILKDLLPEWGELPRADKKLPKRALRRAITRRAILQGGGVWLAIITFITMFFIALPIQLELLLSSELSDYLAFYLVADIVSRVLYVIALLLFILDIVGAVLWQRGSGFGYDRTYITITNSGFSTNRTIIPRVKVQLATLQTNPLQRHRQLTTIIALTAAGVGSSTLKLIDVEQDAAKAWFDWCHPGGNKTLPAQEHAIQ